MIKKITILFTVIILILMVFKNLLEPKYMLVIEDMTNKKNYEFILKNKKFSLGYTHSVMKTEAEEIFVAEENKKINLMELVFHFFLKREKLKLKMENLFLKWKENLKIYRW